VLQQAEAAMTPELGFRLRLRVPLSSGDRRLGGGDLTMGWRDDEAVEARRSSGRWVW
jgi:hypothetical protein